MSKIPKDKKPIKNLSSILGNQKKQGYLTGGIAEEYLRAFYESVKQFSGYQYPERLIIEGEEKPCTHIFLYIKPPTENRLEVREIIDYVEKRIGKTKYHKDISNNVLIVRTYQLKDRLKIIAEYSPFFKELVEDILSNSDKDNTATKKRRPLEIHVPTRYPDWQNWHIIYNDKKCREIYFSKSDREGTQNIWELIQTEVMNRLSGPTKITTLKALFKAGDLEYLVDFQQDMARLKKQEQENTG